MLPLRAVTHLVLRPALLAIGMPARRGLDAPVPPLRPHARSRRWGFVHYNVVLPTLPEPHRFLACAVFVGQPGALVFDADHAVVGSPRRTVTVGTGTAATAPGTFAALSSQDDCDLADDGSHLRFGDVLTLDREGPAVRVAIRQDGLRADLELRPSEHPCWFARSPLYEHFGVPAPYEGTVEHAGRTTTVTGTASLEHARGVTAHALVDRPVPELLKLPLALFAYHVLDLGDGRGLLLTYTEALGAPLLRTAHVVAPGARPRTLEGPLTFEMAPADRWVVAPDGRRTAMPAAFRWRVGDRVAVEVRPDTGLVYGIGTGWMGGAAVRGTVDGRPVEGRAYLEHVDRR